jgi:hypothetical protein
MGQDAQATFALAGGLGATRERRSQATLVPRKSTLRLPALPVLAFGEAFLHLAAVFGLRPFATLIATIDRDDRGTDAEFFAGQPMIGLAIEGRIPEHAIPGDDQASLLQRRAELRGVITGAEGHCGRGEEVTTGVAGDRELDPRLRAQLPPRTLEERVFTRIRGRMRVFLSLVFP